MNLLLSPKTVEDFTPTEWKAYVSSLHIAPAPPPSEVSAGVNAKGTLILYTRRKPKWCTRLEIVLMGKAVGRDEREVWNKAKEKGFVIVGEISEGKKLKVSGV